MKSHFISMLPGFTPKPAGIFLSNRLFNPLFTRQTGTHRTQKEGMKLKTLLASLLGIFLLQHLALSQTNLVTPDQPAVASVTNAVATDVVPVVAAADTNQPVAVLATNAPVEVVVTPAPAVRPCGSERCNTSTPSRWSTVSRPPAWRWCMTCPAASPTASPRGGSTWP